MINFLHEYMINKDSKEHLLWLKTLKNFVKSWGKHNTFFFQFSDALCFQISYLKHSYVLFGSILYNKNEYSEIKSLTQ